MIESYAGFALQIADPGATQVPGCHGASGGRPDSLIWYLRAQSNQIDWHYFGCWKDRSNVDGLENHQERHHYYRRHLGRHHWPRGVYWAGYIAAHRCFATAAHFDGDSSAAEHHPSWSSRMPPAHRFHDGLGHFHAAAEVGTRHHRSTALLHYCNPGADIRRILRLLAGILCLGTDRAVAPCTGHFGAASVRSVPCHS